MILPKVFLDNYFHVIFKDTYDSSIKIKREQKRNSEKFIGVCMVIIWFYNRFSSQIWRLYSPDHTIKVLSLEVQIDRNLV